MRAPRAQRDLADSGGPCMASQNLAQIDGTRTGGRSEPELLDYVDSNHIVGFSDGHATMHDKLLRRAPRNVAEAIDSLLENPSYDSSPPGMQQGHTACWGMCQVHWDTVCHGDGEHNAGVAGDMAVVSTQDQPSVKLRFVLSHLCSVWLEADGDAREFVVEGLANLAPPIGDRPRVLGGHQPEVEISSGSPGGYTGHQPVGGPPG